MKALFDTAAEDSHWMVRYEAGRALSWMGESAVPVLIDGMESRDPDTRRAAMEVLEMIGPDAQPALPQLMSEALSYIALPCSERSTRAPLPLMALASIGPGAAVSVPLFLDALEHGTDADRPRAAAALAGFGPAAAPAVTALVRTLGTRGTHKDRFHPVGSQTDDRTWLRESSAQALGRIGPLALRATPALVKALKDPSIEVKIEAARALGRIGHADREVVMGLLETNYWPTGCIRINRMGEEANAALEALLVLGEDAVPFLLEALETERRLDAAKTFVAMGATDTAAVPGLVVALAEWGSTRTEAAILLARTRDAHDVEIAEILRARENALSPDLREYVWRVMDVFYEEEVAPLAPMPAEDELGSGAAPEEDVGIGESVGLPPQRASHRDVQELIHTLRHGETLERELAAEELGKIGDPVALPALIEALDEPLLNPARFYSRLDYDLRFVIDQHFNWIREDRTSVVRMQAAQAIGHILGDDPGY
jgi:HEAT repeat protein